MLRENQEKNGLRTKDGAFTLVEMLTVIAIMGIVAGLVVTGVKSVGKKRDFNKVETQLTGLKLALEHYKDKFGSYPQDNPASTITNALFYELSGTVFADNPGNPTLSTFTVINGAQVITSSNAQLAFGAAGFVNTHANRQNVKTFLPELNANEHGEISSAPSIEVLKVSVKGPVMHGTNNDVNPWHYVSTNPTNNPGRYDLWAEILIGSETNIIGNWKR